MRFPNEDRAAWMDSEVMMEFEKYAEEVFSGPPDQAYLGLDEDWEDESLEDALEEFEKPPAEDEMLKEMNLAYNSALISNLQKLSSHFAEKSNIKTAYRIEQTVFELRDCIRRNNE